MDQSFRCHEGQWPPQKGKLRVSSCVELVHMMFDLLDTYIFMIITRCLSTKYSLLLFWQYFFPIFPAPSCPRLVHPCDRLKFTSPPCSRSAPTPLPDAWIPYRRQLYPSAAMQSGQVSSPFLFQGCRSLDCVSCACQSSYFGVWDPVTQGYA